MKHLIMALRNPTDHHWLELRPWRRHSLVLTLGGTIYVAIGFAYLLTSTSTRTTALVLPLHWLPMSFWALLFVVAGLLGILSARWPPASEKWGYTTLTGLAALWGSFFLLGTVLLDAPPSGASGALTWYLLAILWWAISGLDNPHDRVADE